MKVNTLARNRKRDEMVKIKTLEFCKQGKEERLKNYKKVLKFKKNEIKCYE